MSKSPFYRTGISKSPLYQILSNQSSAKKLNKLKKGQLTGPDLKEAQNEIDGESIAKMKGSPLYDTTHGKEGHAHPHTLKEYRAQRKGEIDKMQAKLNTLKEGTPAFNKQADKIDAHDLETTKKVRNFIK